MRKSDLNYCEINTEEGHDWQLVGCDKGWIIHRCSYCYQCYREKPSYVINKKSEMTIKQWALPVVSIIIPSFKRVELLKWGLYSLSKQESPYPFEVIVLNDGLEQDNTEQLCKQYSKKMNIRYIYTGERNKKKEMWRCPGFAFNIGVKQAKADYIILTCPEIYHFDKLSIKKMVDELKKSKQLLVRTFGRDDQSGEFLSTLIEKEGKIEYKISVKRITKELNTKMPFFLGLHKQSFIDIGGYDEDLIGWAYDDTDLIGRLERYNCKFIQTDSMIIHLYHPRHRIGIQNNLKMYKYNQKIYESKDKDGVIFSNEDKEWGILGDISEKVVKAKNSISKKWELKAIPKIAHFYWGNITLPYLRYLSLLSFHKYNPDWKINLYVPIQKYKGKCLDTGGITFDFTGKDYYKGLKDLSVNIIETDFSFIGIDALANNKLSQKHLSRQEVYRSDFLRWHLLSTIGGLWSDMDIMYFKPITEIDINTNLNKKINTVISIHPKYGHSVGFMLSGQNNPYYNYIFNYAKEKFNPIDYQSIGVNLLNEKFPSTEAIGKNFPNLKGTVKNIDVKTVYAYDALCIPTVYQSSNMTRYTQNSIGLHWYAGHALAREYIVKMNHLNYSRWNNVLRKTIEKVYHEEK